VGQTFLSATEAAEYAGRQECLPHKDQPIPQVWRRTAKTERRARDFQSGQELTEERIVTSYQEVGGRMMPKRVTVNRDGKKMMDVEIVEARSLEKVDDSEFVKP